MNATKANTDLPATRPVTKWRKSSYSGDNGSCLEAARLGDDRVAIRDSKDPDLRPLVFTSAQWARFLVTVRTGGV